MCVPLLALFVNKYMYMTSELCHVSSEGSAGGQHDRARCMHSVSCMMVVLWTDCPYEYSLTTPQLHHLVGCVALHGGWWAHMSCAALQ